MNSGGKTALRAAEARLHLFEHALPSLDLKRQQLAALQRQEQRSRDQANTAAVGAADAAAQVLPVTWQDIDLPPPVWVEGVDIGRENVFGSELPRLDAVHLGRLPAGQLGAPPWLELVQDHLARALQCRVEATLAEARRARLGRAHRTTVQRVNLFEQQLIPRARQEVRRLHVAMVDTERAAVVRAKLIKARRAAQGATA